MTLTWKQRSLVVITFTSTAVFSPENHWMLFLENWKHHDCRKALFLIFDVVDFIVKVKVRRRRTSDCFYITYYRVLRTKWDIYVLIINHVILVHRIYVCIHLPVRLRIGIQFPLFPFWTQKHNFKVIDSKIVHALRAISRWLFHRIIHKAPT